MIRARFGWLTLLAVVVSWRQVARAACEDPDVCEARALPTVCSIEASPGGFTIVLGGSYVPGDDFGPTSRSKMAYDAKLGWRSLASEPATPCGSGARCPLKIPRRPST